MDKSKTYYLLLDPLRWFLASMVILFHFWSWTPNDSFWQDNQVFTLFAKNGFLAVDAFFVISGIAISHSLKHKNPAQFLKMRFIRLIPAFICVSLLETLLIVFMKVRGEWGESYGAIFITAFTNILPLSGEASKLRNFVSWSLGLEVLFYVSMAVTLLYFRNTKFDDLIFHSILRSYLQFSLVFIYCCQFLSFEFFLQLSFIQYWPYFLLGILLELLFNSSKSYILESICLFPIVAKLILNRATVGEKTFGENIFSIIFISLLILSIVISLRFRDQYMTNQAAKLREIGHSSYFLFLIGGKFGITIFTNTLDFGLYRSMILTYFICTSLTVIYQKYFDGFITRTVSKSS